MVSKNLFSSLFLECVSDDLRQQILKDQLDLSLSEFQNIIWEKDYPILMDYIKKITNAEMTIMFQIHNGNAIELGSKSSDLIILAESDISDGNKKRSIPVLRSELIDYYNSYICNTNNPHGTELLNIENSLKIVLVGERQSDTVVVSFKRIPCVITYIQMQYIIDSTKNKGNLYFALFFKEEKKGHLIEILENVRAFLAFRYEFMKKIQEDFRCNLYGKQKEEYWRNNWLSIEKAGAHADSSFVSDILNQYGYNSSKVYSAFFKDIETDNEKANQNEQTFQIIQLVSNILIARYFRLVFSSSEFKNICQENIVESYYRINDIIDLNQYKKGAPLNHKQTSFCIMDSVMGQMELFGQKSAYPNKKQYSGIPIVKKITYTRKYLIAFLVDIINNAAKHGTIALLDIDKTEGDLPGYFVIKNNIKKNLVFDDCEIGNYLLKQSTEFDNAEDPKKKEGISLGCLTHFMSYYSSLKVYYESNNDDLFFCIKLPIINNNSCGGVKDGEVGNH